MLMQAVPDGSAGEVKRWAHMKLADASNDGRFVFDSDHLGGYEPSLFHRTTVNHYLYMR